MCDSSPKRLLSLEGNMLSMITMYPLSLTLNDCSYSHIVTLSWEIWQGSQYCLFAGFNEQSGRRPSLDRHKTYRGEAIVYYPQIRTCHSGDSHPAGDLTQLYAPHRIFAMAFIFIRCREIRKILQGKTQKPAFLRYRALKMKYIDMNIISQTSYKASSRVAELSLLFIGLYIYIYIL